MSPGGRPALSAPAPRRAAKLYVVDDRRLDRPERGRAAIHSAARRSASDRCAGVRICWKRARLEARYDRRMTADSLPLRLLLATLAGWVNRHQQQVIDYLVEENRALREQLRERRVRLNNDQRRRLSFLAAPGIRGDEIGPGAPERLTGRC